MSQLWRRFLEPQFVACFLLWAFMVISGCITNQTATAISCGSPHLWHGGVRPPTKHSPYLQFKQSLNATFEARNPIGFPAIFSWQENRRFSTILGGEKRTRRSPLASKLAPKDWIGGGEILIAIAEAPFVPFMCLLCFLNHSTVPTYFVAKECLLLWCLHKLYAKSWKPHILIKRKEVNVEKHYAQCNMLAHHYLLVLKTLSVKCIFNLFLL